MKRKVTLYFFRGWPGSGKSTKAKEYQQQGLFSHYYENDMFLYDKEGNYVWSKERLTKAIEQTHQHVMAELKKGNSVGLCSVAWHVCLVIDWLKICKENGWWLNVIDCTGDFQNIHNVSDEKVERMKQKFQPWIQNKQGSKVCHK